MPGEEFKQKYINQLTCLNPECKRKKKNGNDQRLYRNSVKTQLRYAIKSSLSRANNYYIKEVKDLPYSISELKEHLEMYFETGMTWDNRGCRSGKGRKYSREIVLDGPLDMFYQDLISQTQKKVNLNIGIF